MYMNKDASRNERDIIFIMKKTFPCRSIWSAGTRKNGWPALQIGRNCQKTAMPCPGLENLKAYIRICSRRTRLISDIRADSQRMRPIAIIRNRSQGKCLAAIRRRHSRQSILLAEQKIYPFASRRSYSRRSWASKTVR